MVLSVLSVLSLVGFEFCIFSFVMHATPSIPKDTGVGFSAPLRCAPLPPDFASLHVVVAEPAIESSLALLPLLVLLPTAMFEDLLKHLPRRLLLRRGPHFS